MTDLATYNRYGEELEQRIRLKTFPLAIKMLEKEEDIPAGAQRPLRDMGHHLSLCQGFQFARRDGISIAMLLKDMWCIEPVIGYGLMAAPPEFMEGRNRYDPYPHDVATMEAGKNYAEEFPKLETGKYVGIAFAPLKTANFVPDVVMIYSDPAQLGFILLAREWKDGRNLKCPLSSHAACVYGPVPAMLTGQCQIAVPCRGDHYSAMAGDDEIIFTVPREKLEELIEGFRFIAQYGSRLPRSYKVLHEYDMAKSYEKIAQIMGYR